MNYLFLNYVGGNIQFLQASSWTTADFALIKGKNLSTHSIR